MTLNSPKSLAYQFIGLSKISGVKGEAHEKGQPQVSSWKVLLRAMDFLRALSKTSSDQVARKAPNYWNFPSSCGYKSLIMSCKASSSTSHPVPGHMHMSSGPTCDAPDKPANWRAIGFHAARMLRVLLGGTINGEISCR